LAGASPRTLLGELTMLPLPKPFPLDVYSVVRPPTQIPGYAYVHGWTFSGVLE